MTLDAHAGGPRCASLAQAAAEPLAGSAPRAEAWVVVEHPSGWGDAALARSADGVRVLMARGARGTGPGGAGRDLAGPDGAGPDGAGPDGAGPDGAGPDGAGLDGAGCVRVWVAYCSPDPVLRLGLVDEPDEVAAWDLAELAAGSHRGWGRADPRPLLLVCANGRRDRCCGHSGGRLAEQLWNGPLGARVLTCTHLGGHRFAPTALVLPWGALHGRLDLNSSTALLEQAPRGRMPGSTLRGFSTQSEPAQVAEAHARALTGHDGLAPLPVDVTGTEEQGRARAVVQLPGVDGRLGGRAHAVVQLPGIGGRPGGRVDVDLVRTTRPVVASCGREAEPTTRWSVLGPPAGRISGWPSGTMPAWTSDSPDARS